VSYLAVTKFHYNDFHNFFVRRSRVYYLIQSCQDTTVAWKEVHLIELGFLKKKEISYIIYIILHCNNLLNSMQLKKTI